MLRLSPQQAAKLAVGKPKHSPAKSDKPAVRKKSAKVADDGMVYKKGRLPSGDVFREISFTIPVRSRPKHRARTFADETMIRSAFFMAKGNVEAFLKAFKMKTLSTKETREFEKYVRDYSFAKLINFPKFDEPVEVEVIVKFSGDPGVWPTAHTDGDLDNHEKAVFDALNGVLYTDDKLIVSKISRKICILGKDEIEVTARTALRFTDLEE